MIDQELDPNRSGAGDRAQIVVLLVDDQAFVGAAVGRLLATEHDIAFHACLNALDAVAAADALNPTVILQDLVMPGLDGMALVRLFRANARTAGTPVIVLSGNDDSETRARALEAGASDFLVKLPAKADLIACIRRHAVAGATQAVTGRVPEGATAATRLDEDQTLDRAFLASVCDTDVSSGFARRLIDGFLQTAASQVESLKDAARRSDKRQTDDLAHSLKGSSLTMGAKRLGALCARLEASPVETAGALVPELDDELARVREALLEVRNALSPE